MAAKNSGKLIKKTGMKHRTEYFFYLLFSQIARFTGVASVNKLGKLIGNLFYYLIPIRKSVVINNLRMAFPDKTGAEIEQIAKMNYTSFATTFLEIALIYYLKLDEIKKLMDCSNLEKFSEEMSSSDNGAILLTAHYGNWELGALSVGIWLNKPISVLAKKQKNLFVAHRMKAIREKFGNKEVLLGASVRELYKTLKNGGYIGVVGDQRAPKDSIRVNFFGRQTPVFPGMASLALKLKPPIYVLLFRRLEDGKYVLEAEPLGYENMPEDNEAAQVELTQRYINILEKYIRKSPEQWLWMHKIWKYKLD